MSKGLVLEFDECSFEDTATADNVDDLIAAKNYSSKKYTLITVVDNAKLRMWIKDESENSENVFGSLTFSIYKIDQSKQDPVQVLTTIINKDDDFQIHGEDGLYELSVSEMKVIEDEPPTPKYPSGTYQITLNQEVGRNKNESVLQEISVQKKAELRFSNDKLISLNGIEIPPDVDPLNRYVMLGKIELDLYLDFNSDKYYLYPTSYAECFMNLFVPKMKVEEIEDTNDHALYHITDYELIEFDYRDCNKIKNAIKRWINCNDRDIRNKHEVYFYVDTFNLYSWYYAKFRDIIEKHFIYVKIDADVYGEDNVNSPISNNNDNVESFTIQTCTWQKWTRTNKFNHIDWNVDEWESAGTEDNNDIMINATGSGVIRVSKKHFEQVIGGDINEIEEHDLDKTQLEDLHVNMPIIPKYNRFQYWLGIDL